MKIAKKERAISFMLKRRKHISIINISLFTIRTVRMMHNQPSHLLFTKQ